MSRPPLEVADIFRAHAWEFLLAHGSVVSFAKKKVLRALVACRTAVLGGHHVTCSETCGYERFAYTRKAFDRGELSFQGHLAPLARPQAFSEYLAPLYDKKWVVYAKPPFGGPKQVLKYLARYTHRVAISNSRLVSLEDGEVRFRWKDYARRDRQRVMALPAVEFIRRFLLHVLPKGYVHIRHFGFIGNAVRAQKLALCRTLIAFAGTDMPSLEDVLPADTYDPMAEAAGSPCPRCGKGHIVDHVLDPVPGPDPCRAPRRIDSS